jgi:hypothetical protein
VDSSAAAAAQAEAAAALLSPRGSRGGSSGASSGSGGALGALLRWGPVAYRAAQALAAAGVDSCTCIVAFVCASAVLEATVAEV